MKCFRLLIVVAFIGTFFSACNTARFYANKRIDHAYEIEKEKAVGYQEASPVNEQEELSKENVITGIEDKPAGSAIGDNEQPETETHEVSNLNTTKTYHKAERGAENSNKSPHIRIKKQFLRGAAKETKDATKGGGILMIILSLLLAGLALLFHGLLGIMGLIFFFIFGAAACIVFVTGIVYLIIGD